MTTATQTLWGRIVERAKFAWREQNKKPDAIAEKFYRRERLASGIMGALIELVLLAIVVSLIAYITAQIFISFTSPKDWLVYQIAWLYSLICRNNGYCALPYLHAGLVVGVDILVLCTMHIWRAVESIGQPDDLEEVHAHLDLISEQIREDYNSLAKVEERVNAVEVAIEEADSRVDAVVEYVPKAPEGDWATALQVIRKEPDEPEPTAPAA